MAEQNLQAKNILLFVRHCVLQKLTTYATSTDNNRRGAIKNDSRCARTTTQKLPPLEGIYTSPLQRANQTANIAGKFGLTTHLYVDKDFEEGDPAEPGTTGRFDIASKNLKLWIKHSP